MPPDEIVSVSERAVGVSAKGGLARLGPVTVAALGFLSPVTAVILGWWSLGQSLSPLQLVGMAVVLASVRAGQRAASPSPAAAVPPPEGSACRRR
ncbi:EamA family transporter [Methylobacterium currus]|uniref:EamA family transporter n=1 Tax=Methylobacterium currus TaxID=2051553 RepID=UPI0039C060F2